VERLGFRGAVSASDRQILGFLGIDDVEILRAKGMNIPPVAIHAVPNGEKAVEALVL
jgi:FMN-dependent NADH-azoreductase